MLLTFEVRKKIVALWTSSGLLCTSTAMLIHKPVTASLKNEGQKNSCLQSPVAEITLIFLVLFFFSILNNISAQGMRKLQ